MHRRVAIGALHQALSRADEVPTDMRAGLYSGWLGIAYALCAAAQMLELDGFLDAARDLARAAVRQISAGPRLDIIAGDAGAIIALLMLRGALSDDCFLEPAYNHARRLLESAHRADIGWSWDALPGMTHRHPTGLAHGAGGIALALLEMSCAIGDAELRLAADRGFDYERHWFNASQGNWPDFRNVPDNSRTSQPASETEAYSVAWCHGAPGIGLSRLRAHELTNSPEFRDQAETAMRTTDGAANHMLQSESQDFSLCHGIGGLAECLLQAGVRLRISRYVHRAKELGQIGIDRFAKHGRWPSGVRVSGEVPNLMLGTAGVGHFLLQLHEPATPSVTLLVPSTVAVSESRGPRESRLLTL